MMSENSQSPFGDMDVERNFIVSLVSPLSAEQVSEIAEQASLQLGIPEQKLRGLLGRGPGPLTKLIKPHVAERVVGVLRGLGAEVELRPQGGVGVLSAAGARPAPEVQPPEAWLGTDTVPDAPARAEPARAIPTVPDSAGFGDPNFNDSAFDTFSELGAPGSSRPLFDDVPGDSYDPAQDADYGAPADTVFGAEDSAFGAPTAPTLFDAQSVSVDTADSYAQADTPVIDGYRTPMEAVDYTFEDEAPRRWFPPYLVIIMLLCVILLLYLLVPGLSDRVNGLVSALEHALS